MNNNDKSGTGENELDHSVGEEKTAYRDAGATLAEAVVGEPGTETNQNNDLLATLETAAEEGDTSAFLVALKEMKWEGHPPSDFIRITKLALEAGAHMAAREISTEGVKRYPDDPGVQKYARVLAAPKVLSSTLPPDPGLQANGEWILAHGDEYRGKWVAVRDGELMAAAASLDELVRQVGDTRGVLLTPAF